MIGDPTTAPPRPDLTFLRHRGRPRPAAVASPPPAVAVPVPAPASPISAPAVRTTSLDLDAAPAAAALAGAERLPTGPASRTASTAAPPGLAQGSPSPARTYAIPRLTAGGRTILTGKSPTVTLTRIQSGIGTLTFEAACSENVGDLRLGCVYQLASGLSSTVQSEAGDRVAPPHSRRPLLIAGRDRYAHIGIDLRQCRELQRLAIFAYSAAGTPLNWGGTLIATTFGGGRIEVPLEELSGSIAVLATLYNVRGEFVLRAEMQQIVGDIREASRAFGYDRITWLDARNPVE